MPRKIRELIRDLERAGFTDRGGKGNHRNFVHPKVARALTLAGNPGDDAK
jgi:predicted RNA binding protein YcfA (HicA-like mRNA interferase family)